MPLLRAPKLPRGKERIPAQRNLRLMEPKEGCASTGSLYFVYLKSRSGADVETARFVSDHVLSEDGIAVVETELEPVTVAPAKTYPDRTHLEAGRISGTEVFVAKNGGIEEAKEAEAVGLVLPILDATNRKLRGIEFESSPGSVVTTGNSLVETTDGVLTARSNLLRGLKFAIGILSLDLEAH